MQQNSIMVLSTKNEGDAKEVVAPLEAFNMYSNHLKLRVFTELSESGFFHDFRRLAGLSIALVALFVQFSHASEWDAVDNTTDGIQIYRKEVDDTGLVIFRGVGMVEASLPLVATAIFDTARRREWIDGLASSMIIRWQDKDNFIEYDHIGLPFFISDRDFVSKVNISYDKSRKQMVFHYQPSDDHSAPHAGYIRGDLTATFILSYIDEKKTKVDAQFLCDPKGWIPKWLVNFFLKDWPVTTFRNLRKEVLKDLSVDSRFSRLTKK
jgi:hypothetical protein